MKRDVLPFKYSEKVVYISVYLVVQVAHLAKGAMVPASGETRLA